MHMHGLGQVHTHSCCSLAFCRLNAFLAELALMMVEGLVVPEGFLALAAVHATTWTMFVQFVVVMAFTKSKAPSNVRLQLHGHTPLRL